jgi:hypothetical protein
MPNADFIGVAESVAENVHPTFNGIRHSFAIRHSFGIRHSNRHSPFHSAFANPFDIRQSTVPNSAFGIRPSPIDQAPAT